jgi:hypothetical protein
MVMNAMTSRCPVEQLIEGDLRDEQALSDTDGRYLATFRGLVSRVPADPERMARLFDGVCRGLYLGIHRGISKWWILLSREIAFALQAE